MATVTVKVCPHCRQELSKAAYYRHINDKHGVVCPGIKENHEYDGDQSNVSDTDFFSTSDGEMDTSFDFGDDDAVSSMNSFTGDLGEGLDFDSPISSESENEESSLSSGEEIWDSSSDSDLDSEDLERASLASSVHHIVCGLSIFVTTFQLFFRISERAMTSLLLFIYTLVSYLARLTNVALLNSLIQSLPKAMKTARKNIQIYTESGLVEYAVCPKCDYLYKISDSVIIQNQVEVSAKCNFVQYPNHPHIHRRSECSTLLMKYVKVGNKQKLIPRKLFIFNSVICTLKELVCRPGFLRSCEEWRQRPPLPEDVFADVYDGRVWKSLFYIDGTPFLKNPYNFCLLLNVDWFNPFEETIYSAGAIYLVILNLPRSERYKIENMILVGMIPGPREPKRDINSYLVPLVNELLELYHGISVSNSSFPSKTITFRAVLACIGSDLPATRKICGFLSHSARKGCSKCLKEFPTNSFGEKPDFSGYDCENWEPRKLDSHTSYAELVREAPTATARAKLERDSGVRYSKLLVLPYFDVIKFHTIDPMHTLFLGIAKHTTKVWRECNILKKEDFEILQDKVDAVRSPPNIGRIPRKISSGFASFTADEWKQWILTYSIYALNGVLPPSDFKCWLYFVKSCKLLCQVVVSKDEVIASHRFLIEFCKMYQSLYGADKCTPNLHMACHLKDCVLDYGPLPAFWCFSFERYNGMLEKTSISWNGPEKQMFTKFRQLQHIHSFQQMSIKEDDFISLCLNKSLFQQSKTYSSVEQTNVDGYTVIAAMKNHSCTVSALSTAVIDYKLVPPLVEKVFSDTEAQYLTDMYKLIYPPAAYKILHFDRFYKEIRQLYIGGELLISAKSRSQRSSAIVAHWPGVIGIDPRGEAPLRVGLVDHFLQHTLVIKPHLQPETKECKLHLLARVSWLDDHPYRDKYIPKVIMSALTHVPDGCVSYIPISRIHGRCAIVETTVTLDYGDDRVILAMPFTTKMLI